MATVTPAPAWTSLLTTSATLYAAMPPQTADDQFATFERCWHSTRRVKRPLIGDYVSAGARRPLAS